MLMAGLSAAVIPYTPTPVLVEATTILVVEPPPIANELVLNALGPGTSEVALIHLYLQLLSNLIRHCYY